MKCFTDVDGWGVVGLMGAGIVVARPIVMPSKAGTSE